MAKLGNPPLDLCTYGIRRENGQVSFLLVLIQEGIREEFGIHDSLEQLSSFILSLDELLAGHRNGSQYIPESGNILWELQGTAVYSVLMIQSAQPLLKVELTRPDLHILADLLEDIVEVS